MNLIGHSVIKQCKTVISYFLFNLAVFYLRVFVLQMMGNLTIFPSYFTFYFNYFFKFK